MLPTLRAAATLEFFTFFPRARVLAAGQSAWLEREGSAVPLLQDVLSPLCVIGRQENTSSQELKSHPEDRQVNALSPALGRESAFTDISVN